MTGRDAFPPPGDYEIGPPGSRLVLRTFRQGVAARAGHDLVIEAAAWHGTVRVPGEGGSPASVAVEVDVGGLHVVAGTGGVKPLTERDRREIEATMQSQLRAADHPVVSYVSSTVDLTDLGALVEGALTLAGRTQPLQIELRREGDGPISGRAQVVQSRWGVKPYTGFFGALKLRDAVDVELSVGLPPDASPSPPAG